MPEYGVYLLTLDCDDHKERFRGKFMVVKFHGVNLTSAGKVARRLGWESYGLNTPKSRKWRCPGCARAHARRLAGVTS